MIDDVERPVVVRNFLRQIVNAYAGAIRVHVHIFPIGMKSSPAPKIEVFHLLLLLANVARIKSLASQEPPQSRAADRACHSRTDCRPRKNAEAAGAKKPQIGV